VLHGKVFPGLVSRTCPIEFPTVLLHESGFASAVFKQMRDSMTASFLKTYRGILNRLPSDVGVSESLSDMHQFLEGLRDASSGYGFEYGLRVLHERIGDDSVRSCFDSEKGCAFLIKYLVNREPGFRIVVQVATLLHCVFQESMIASAYVLIPAMPRGFCGVKGSRQVVAQLLSRHGERNSELTTQVVIARTDLMERAIDLVDAVCYMTSSCLWGL